MSRGPGPRRAFSWWESLREKLVAVSETEMIGGMQVRVSRDPHGASREHLVRKLGAALELVAMHQPHAMRRMRNDMAIWVREHTMCRAALYPGALPEQRMCVLDSFFVGTFPAEQIASSIVHEGMHARLRRAGVPWTTDQAARAREERMCRKAELRLGRSLPNGAEIMARAEASLLLDDEDVAPRLV